jgi:hypothetical protein
MARKRTPLRDKAKAIWLEHGGKITYKKLAELLDSKVKDYTLRKWKSEDKWQEELDKKKRGGQRGNNNAAGHGAPKGNDNAETHGAYSRVHLENLSPEEREFIEKLTLDAEENMLRELQLLFAKERSLTGKILKYENENPAELFVDKVVEMLVPKSKDEATLFPTFFTSPAWVMTLTSSGFAGGAGHSSIADLRAMLNIPTIPPIPSGANLGSQGTPAFGQAVQNGSAATFARSDHRHALPAAPTIPPIPAGANLSSQASAFGQSAQSGSSGSFARSDHFHALPAFNTGYVTGTFLSSALSTTIELGFRPRLVIVFASTFESSSAGWQGKGVLGLAVSTGTNSLGNGRVTISATGFTSTVVATNSTGGETLTGSRHYVALR